MAGRKKDTRGKVSAMASDGGGHAPAMTDAWGTEDVDTLEGSALEWSTIEEVAGRAKVVRAKACLLCGHTYSGDPHSE